MKLVYNGKVDAKGLTIFRRSQFIDDLNMFQDKNIVITVEQKKKKRSLSQNAYYWSVVIPMVKDGLIDVGYRVTLLDTHDYLKANYLIKEIVNENTGEIIKSIKSTSELSTGDFMDYLAEITQWAAEFLNIQIPEPNEQLQIEI